MTNYSEEHLAELDREAIDQGDILVMGLISAVRALRARIQSIASALRIQPGQEHYGLLLLEAIDKLQTDKATLEIKVMRLQVKLDRLEMDQ